MTKAALSDLGDREGVDRDWTPSGRQMARMPAMLHATNARRELVWVSELWLATLGYARDEVIGRPAIEFFAAKCRDIMLADAFPEFDATGRLDNVERQLLCKDGRKVDALVSVVRWQGEGAGESCALAVVTDVTDRRAAERKIAESEARYRSLIEDQSEFISLAKPDGTLLFVNHAHARLFGSNPADMLGRNFFECIPEADHAAVAAHLDRVLASAETVTSENQVRLPNGETRWISWSNRALPDAGGKTAIIHSVGRDVHRRIVAEQLLKESEARYRLLADQSTDMVFQLDVTLARRYVSPASREILGYEPDELIGGKPLTLIHPDDVGRVSKIMKSLVEGRVERQLMVNRVRHKDGRWVWVEAQLRAFIDQETGVPAGVIGGLRDISARKAVEDQLAEANRRLEALARRDALTGLANRREFDEAFAREYKRFKRSPKALALLMIDVDWFKPFNDLYGHPAGDECLRRVGKALSGSTFRAGDLTARYGGEEFVILLPDTGEAGAAVIAERLRRAVSLMAIRHDGSPHRVVTVSVGAAALEAGAEDRAPETLPRLADRALYRAKAMGRNSVVLASQLTEDPTVTA